MSRIVYDADGNVIGYIIDGKYVSDKSVIEKRKKRITISERRDRELGL